jgi:hypothetical protein
MTYDTEESRSRHADAMVVAKCQMGRTSAGAQIALRADLQSRGLIDARARRAGIVKNWGSLARRNHPPQVTDGI